MRDVNPANDTARPHQITPALRSRGEGNPWNHMAPMRVSFPVCNIPNDEHTRGSSAALQAHVLHENATFREPLGGEKRPL